MNYLILTHINVRVTNKLLTSFIFNSSKSRKVYQQRRDYTKLMLKCQNQITSETGSSFEISQDYKRQYLSEDEILEEQCLENQAAIAAPSFGVLREGGGEQRVVASVVLPITRQDHSHMHEHSDIATVELLNTRRIWK